MCYGVLYAVIVQLNKTRFLVRFLAPILSASILGSVLACSDPFAAKATVAVQTDTLIAYSLTGTPPEFPSGLNTAFRSVVRVDATHNYDVAFDLDTQGQVRLIPVKLMGGLVTTARRVGVQKATATYDALTKAPNTGYTYDSVTVIKPGDTAVLEVTSADQCSFSLSAVIYSKIVVDSVKSSTREIFFRTTHDPNCGFRSFLPGVPKN
ncbi:MAG: hypothetical protein U0132_11925 [Gemmatimonadaceae bacterium]